MTPQTAVTDDAFRTDGFSPSALKAIDRDVTSDVRLMPAEDRRDGVVRMGMWRAEPGTYEVPDSHPGETFVVLKGSGVAEIDGHGSHEVSDGSIVVIPPDTSARLIVRETILKVFVAPVAEVSG
ncbi:MAG: EutQ-like cupin domain [Solirubrobacteraceae bacterium]|jgi:uncharacterized cupin superfamily protein|nr:EutQ-like cupin domain [Solirubrobacteraceae bacterium]